MDKHVILIVDDSPFIQKVLGTYFKEKNFDVIFASDGFEAIQKTFAESPDLIVLDINMPKINGYQVCRLLKDHKDSQDIPIIIGTSKESSVVSNPKAWSFETGANGFFDKNINNLDLLMNQVYDLLKNHAKKKHTQKIKQRLTEMEILTYLSSLLDKQLYNDVTELKDLNERKSAFVANVAHELRSPLAVIKASQELLLTKSIGELTQKQQEILESCLRSITRLTRMVNDLLDLSRIESGKVELKKEKLDLSECFENVIETYHLAYKAKDITVEKNNFENNVFINGDRDKMTNAIINIFSNSIKFTQNGGKIVLRLFKEHGFARIEIHDDGPGIDENNLKIVFDKFERIGSDKEGTGLGLPISKDIIALHGGDIWVESKIGQGANFIIKIPLFVS